MKLKPLCLSLFLIFVSGLNAQWLHEKEITLLIEPGEENDPFPRAIKSVSIDNNKALIGTFRSETVYLYTRDEMGNWFQESRLKASDGTNFDFFGYSVSISEERILVGAQSSDAKGINSGAAYIYEQNENGVWFEKAKLTASDGREAHFFGASSSISKDIAVVSAVQGPRRGDVYIYERNINGDWIERDKLQPDGRSGSDKLGSSVSINGNSIIIGAPGDNGKGEESGTAYIFTKDENGEWFQEAKLTPEDIASEYQFGRSVSISGDKAVVASFGAERTDAAYVYTRDSNGVWQQETKLIPSNVSTDNFFNNSSVCISGDRILLVASINNGESGNLSSAFIYIRDENGLWSEESKLPKSDGYAHTVGLDGDKALVASKFGGMVNFFTSDTSPIQLDIQALITSPPCSGSENGSIQIDATGGKTPYRYELLDENLNVIITAQENNIFENLGQGTYIVKVIDDTTQEIFTNALAIIEPEILQATPIINNVACHGSNDGSVEIVVNGGSTPYQYSINGGGSTSNNEFTNLSPATYTFEVIDANGCQITTDVTIDQPEILGMDKYKTDTSCRGLNDGSITINGSGGVTPYEFSLDGANFETVNSFVDLSPATYDVYIKDARGCTQTTQVVVSEPNGSDFDNDGLGDSCDYDIDGDGIANENDKCSQTSLGSLVDSDGCVFFSLPADNFTVQATGATCPNTTNGSINISAILPFDYTAILTGNTFIESKQFDKSLSFENLGAGIYDVCVTIDEHSDFEECFSVEITEPEALSVSSRTDSSGKSLVLNLSGGINYNVNLNDTIYYIDENEIILPLSEIENSLTVTTDRECQGIYRETILVAFGLSLYPNPVERGDVTLRIEDNSINDVQLFLYTSSGRQIFQKTAKVENGTVMIKMNGLSSGMYSLKLETPKEIYTRKIIKI